jgi:chromosome segregation protein
LAHTEKAQQEFKAQIAAFEKKLHEFEKEFENVSVRCSSLEQERKTWREKVKAAEEAVGKGAQKRRDLESQGHKLELLISQQVALAQAIDLELNERFQFTIEQARGLSLRMEASLELSEREMRRLRRELEKADQVNLGAIEEFEAHKKRHQELTSQIEDLEGSRNELAEVIDQLDRSSRKLFTDTFEQIRSNFHKHFQVLFEGGEADLTFTDSDDVLEAGIDIVAKPPGKQMRSITLLSGGEKCMTAMALLFAIFEVKPAPFCILDEMDAPLDDTNVERFVRVLKPFMEKTQFLIITHNKRTMSVADVLFGVSMEEKGISKLISIAFDREKSEAAV